MEATEIAGVNFVYKFRTHNQQLGTSCGKHTHYVVRIFVLPTS